MSGGEAGALAGATGHTIDVMFARRPRRRRCCCYSESSTDTLFKTTRLTRKGDTTLLVPLDRAIMALPTKPHQNPNGETSEKEARTNVESFLSAHIVPSSLDMPAKNGKDTQTLHDGVSVRVEGEEGSWVVQPGDIKVVAVKQASNGKILYLDGVVKS